jgi:hypothetical protein
MDGRLIEQAKLHAQARGISLSQLVAEYFAGLDAGQAPGRSYLETLPPITRSLVGALKRGESGREEDQGEEREEDGREKRDEYRRHLAAKYR